MLSKLFKKKHPKEVKSAVMNSDHGDMIKSINKDNGNLDASYYSYQSYNQNNLSFSNHPNTPSETKQSETEISDRIPLNQNFSSIFNVPPPANNVIFL